MVLRLAILLHDPIPTVVALLHDAHRPMEEFRIVTIGHIAYFQILQTSIERYSAALKEYAAQQNAALDISPGLAALAENEFQGHVPNGFVFEWDSSGSNLNNMPLAWQDYFINIDGLL
jgi:hypothetical protein